jgi:FtsH-binding integral membrane protein
MLKSKLFAPMSLKKYSRPGMASSAIALLVGLILIAAMLILQLGQNNPDTVQNFKVIDPYLTWVVMFLSMVGLMLGIAAARSGHGNRFFGFIGLVINGLFLLGIISLYVVNGITLLSG